MARQKYVLILHNCSCQFTHITKIAPLFQYAVIVDILLFCLDLTPAKTDIKGFFFCGSSA